MGLFNWLFGVGDEVEYDGGKKSGKVQRHRPEGMVDIPYGRLLVFLHLHKHWLCTGNAG